MLSDKVRLLNFFSTSDSSIQNIKWEVLLVLILAILVVLIITFICEYSDNLFRCHHCSPQHIDHENGQ
jgi:ABC-type multidrug transport system permease subunit